jgi:prepilin signal peptidase PulO-like enzyme (type II secretory pathway)
LKIGKKIIEPSWEGLTKEELKLIKKKLKIVKIRQGIPFVPVFFIAFLVLFYLWKTGLWSSFL